MGDVNPREFVRTPLKPREIALAITRGNSFPLTLIFNFKEAIIMQKTERINAQSADMSMIRKKEIPGTVSNLVQSLRIFRMTGNARAADSRKKNSIKPESDCSIYLAHKPVFHHIGNTDFLRWRMRAEVVFLTCIQRPQIPL